jgi:hypothetical protein
MGLDDRQKAELLPRRSWAQAMVWSRLLLA